MKTGVRRLVRFDQDSGKATVVTKIEKSCATTVFCTSPEGNYC